MVRHIYHIIYCFGLITTIYNFKNVIITFFILLLPPYHYVLKYGLKIFVFYITDVAGTNDSWTKINTNGILESGTNTDNDDAVISEHFSKMNLTKMQTRCSQTNFTIQIHSCATPENATEMRKSPKVKFTKSIKSSNYLSGANNIAPNKTRHHTTSSRCRSPSPVNRSFGFKVNGEDGKITKSVDWSSTRIEMSDFHTPFLIPLHPPSTTESRITDFGSEYYESCCCSSPKSNMYLTNSSINTSDSHTKGLFSREIIVEEKLSPTKLLRANLSCGGVQIHSYKEKQCSEDIVFQGEWQRQSPKTSEKAKKIPVNPSVTKKLTELSNKKKRSESTIKPLLNKFEQNLEVKSEIKKPGQLRTKALKLKQDIVSKTEHIKKNELSRNLVKTITNKNVLKVSVYFFNKLPLRNQLCQMLIIFYKCYILFVFCLLQVSSKVTVR